MMEAALVIIPLYSNTSAIPYLHNRQHCTTLCRHIPQVCIFIFLQEISKATSTNHQEKVKLHSISSC
uniref:Uncharacterized protein n=1 Tax=Oryza brachyantha TaxID=4533 RepID=J3L2G4_ORYBR